MANIVMIKENIVNARLNVVMMQMVMEIH